MSAPARPPFYYEPLSNGDVGIEPAHATAELIDDLASTATTFPDWLVDDLGIAVDLTVVHRDRGSRTVLGWHTEAAQGTVTITADPSGWLLVVGAVGGRNVFTAYLDRPYDEYEMWPPGARPLKDEEGPGRMGKKRTWVSFRVEAWPALAPLANAQGGVNVAVDDARLRVRMETEEAERR